MYNEAQRSFTVLEETEGSITADSWSDNGPEYISEAVAKYLDARRITHERLHSGPGHRTPAEAAG